MVIEDLSHALPLDREPHSFSRGLSIVLSSCGMQKIELIWIIYLAIKVKY